MAHIVQDRVKETSTTTGTGTYALAGAVSNFRALSAVMANNDTCTYAAVDRAGGGWEVGKGTWLTGNSLARTTILASSNSGAAVSWSAGTRDVFIDFSAQDAITSRARFDLSAGVPPDSGFTWFDQNSASITEDVGKGLHLLAGARVTGSHRLVGRYKAVPSTPYTLTTSIDAEFSYSSNNGYFVGWTDATKVHSIALWAQAEYLIEVDKWVTSTTSVGTDYTSQRMIPNGSLFFQVADDGTNVAFRYSADGKNFKEVYTVAKASGYLGGSGYTNLIWGISTRNETENTLSRATLRLWDTAARAFP